MTESFPIAHVRTVSDGTWDEPHALVEHSFQVALLAEAFAKSFAPGWATLAGRWHDLGKFSRIWQRYLKAKSGYDAENAHIEQQPGRVPHATAGALHAIKTLGPGAGH